MEQKMLKLSNKIKLVLNQVDGSEIFCASILIASGYAEEKADREGVTYMLSRLMLSGTTRYMNRDTINLKIKAMGGKIDTQIYEEYTKISLTVPKSRALSAINFLAELVFNLKFNEQNFEIEKKMALVEQEKYLQNPNFVGRQYLKFLAFKRTGLCNSPLGKAKTLEKLTMEEVRNYFHKILHPKNIVISCAGSFDEADVKQVCEDKFGEGAPYSELAKPEKYVPVIFGKDEYEKYKVRNLYQTRFFLGFRAPDYNDFKKYYISIYLKMVEFFCYKYFSTKPYFFGVNTDNLTYSNNGLAVVHFMVNHEDVDKALAEFNECMEKTKNTLLPELFEIEKKNLIGELLRSFNSMDEISVRCGIQYLYSKKPYNNTEIIEQIQKMTFQEYQNVIQTYITQDKMYVAYVGKKVDSVKDKFTF